MQKNKQIIIAMDGYGGAGKGTTAQLVAAKLGYTYMDTGAMYRAVTLYAQQYDFLSVSEEKKVAMMDDISLAYHHNDNTNHDDMYLNGENVEDIIRTIEISELSRHIVPIQGVRDRLVEIQKEMGKNR